MAKLRLPRLSRRWKIIRNLALTLVCLYALWAWAGYPLPTAEMEFRRLERQSLMPPSQVQGAFRLDQERVVVGVLEDRVIFSEVHALDEWPRSEEGTTLVPIGHWMQTELDVIAVDVPPETRSARLDMSLDCWYCPRGNGWSASGKRGGVLGEDLDSWTLWTKEFHIEGEPLKEGGVLFRVPVDDRASMEGTLLRQLARRYTYEQSAALRGLNCRMEAVFYGEDGRELGRAELATPEDGEHAVN